MSEITREELAAFTDASTKSAVALEKVSTYLEAIAEKQAKCAEVTASIVEEKLKNSSIAKDVEHVKWFVGIIGLVIIIVGVMLRIAGTTMSENSNVHQLKAIEHLLTEHEQRDTIQDKGVLIGQPIRRDVQPQ
jgi:cellobiose-specific phosphotransferase system component IIC